MTLDPQDEYDLYDIRDLERDPDDDSTEAQEPPGQSERAETPKADREGCLWRLFRRR